MLTEDELVETMRKERHRTLKVWRDAVALARDVYAHTATFPPEERFGLTSQLRRAAVSVASNIAEGSRRLPTDNQNFLRYALGSLAECDTQLIIAEQFGYGTYTRRLKAAIMSLTMGIRAYAWATRLRGNRVAHYRKFAILGASHEDKIIRRPG